MWLRCRLLISAKRPERVSFHPLKARQSLSLERLKRDTAHSPVYGRFGIRDEQFSASPHRKATTAQNATWLVKAKENITIAPRCRQIVTGIVEAGKEQKLPPLVCIEPVQIPIEGILPARALSRVEKPEHVMTSQTIARRPEGFRAVHALWLQISATKP